ncbi:MAG: 4-(cytidine 5'-diphospho)-2-C-methyl-D-erythritol kinase [Acidimicrobiia bacterium]|nr:4-(cytidine 5'-diphospho)-2-C-methyl-D-erythritol kinase [Acidimicrobiia bacterium]
MSEKRTSETVWEAPAKLNLSLQLRPRDRSGYHPLRSLCQTIQRVDLLTVSEGEDEQLVVSDPNLSADEDNLVWKAVRALVGRPDRPRLVMHLDKAIPAAAGLGGGSSDAAAALLAAARVYRKSMDDVRTVAPEVGADVVFFLEGGTRWMEGYGEVLTEAPPLTGFAVGVAVPDFEISTPAAYREWDRLDEPRGPVLPPRAAPPGLRDLELRNDLVPAAYALEPELGDWAVDLAARWERPVAMTGSGSAHYGFFADVEEAAAAVSEVEGVRSAFAADLRRVGVGPR